MESKQVFRVAGSTKGGEPVVERVGGGWNHHGSRARPHPLIPTLTGGFESEVRS